MRRVLSKTTDRYGQQLRDMIIFKIGFWDWLRLLFNKPVKNFSLYIYKDVFGDYLTPKPEFGDSDYFIISKKDSF